MTSQAILTRGSIIGGWTDQKLKIEICIEADCEDTADEIILSMPDWCDRCERDNPEFNCGGQYDYEQTYFVPLSREKDFRREFNKAWKKVQKSGE